MSCSLVLSTFGVLTTFICFLLDAICFWSRRLVLLLALSAALVGTAVFRKLLVASLESSCSHRNGLYILGQSYAVHANGRGAQARPERRCRFPRASVTMRHRGAKMATSTPLPSSARTAFSFTTGLYLLVRVCATSRSRPLRMYHALPRWFRD